MRAPLPPNYKKPTWAGREFRLLILAAVLGLSALAVIVFEIVPKQRAAEAASKSARGDAKAYVPRPASDASPREQRYDGMLEKTKDMTPLDVPDEAYTYLVRHLAKVDPAAISKDAKTVDYKYFAENPADLRGQTVRVSALFLKSEPLRLEQKAGDFEWRYRTFFSSGNGTEGYVVDFLLDRAPQFERRDAVTFDAVFLKLGTYEGSKGPVQAPFFVGKSIRAVRGAAETASMGTGTMVVGVAIVSALFVGLLSVRIFSQGRPRKGPELAQISVGSGKA